MFIVLMLTSCLITAYDQSQIEAMATKALMLDISFECPKESQKASNELIFISSLLFTQNIAQDLYIEKNQRNKLLYRALHMKYLITQALWHILDQKDETLNNLPLVYDIDPIPNSKGVKEKIYYSDIEDIRRIIDESMQKEPLGRLPLLYHFDTILGPEGIKSFYSDIKDMRNDINAATHIDLKWVNAIHADYFPNYSEQYLTILLWYYLAKFNPLNVTIAENSLKKIRSMLDSIDIRLHAMPSLKNFIKPKDKNFKSISHESTNCNKSTSPKSDNNNS